MVGAPQLFALPNDASQLLLGSHDVTVFERRSRPGGPVNTEEMG